MTASQDNRQIDKVQTSATALILGLSTVLLGTVLVTKGVAVPLGEASRFATPRWAAMLMVVMAEDDDAGPERALRGGDPLVHLIV